MAEERFKIIFEKLDELSKASPEDGGTLPAEVEAVAPELEEIAELRRLSADIAEPPSTSYTST